MSNMQSNEKKIIMGTVTAIYGPEWREKKDGTPYFGPGRIHLDVKGSTCEVSCWANEEIMPPLWTGINLDTIRGRNVVISATYDKEYTNPNSGETKYQYKNPTDIQYLDGDEPTQDAPEPTGEEDAPPPPAQHTFSLDERIAWNSSVNNAVQSHPFKGDPLDAEARSKWLGEIDVLALDIYHLIRRGPVEPAVELEDEFESLGSI
jgi:hypothetical protein